MCGDNGEMSIEETYALEARLMKQGCEVHGHPDRRYLKNKKHRQASISAKYHIKKD